MKISIAKLGAPWIAKPNHAPDTWEVVNRAGGLVAGGLAQETATLVAGLPRIITFLSSFRDTNPIWVDLQVLLTKISVELEE